MNSKKNIVHAQAVLKAPGGKNIASEAATTKNINELLPSEPAVSKAIQTLKENGFAVQGGFPTLSVSGEKALFEKVFNLRLTQTGEGAAAYFVADGKASIPAAMKPVISAIVFPEPVETFQ